MIHQKVVFLYNGGFGFVLEVGLDFEEDDGDGRAAFGGGLGIDDALGYG